VRCDHGLKGTQQHRQVRAHGSVSATVLSADAWHVWINDGKSTWRARTVDVRPLKTNDRVDQAIATAAAAAGATGATQSPQNFEVQTGEGEIYVPVGNV
jgi:hypothetical protein